ncbi:MAG: GGDEF domain-containing protein [Pseudomonadota bacterium]
MPDISHLAIYLSGTFGGISVLVLLLSLLIGYAYTERMLWWHAGALAAALPAQGLSESSPRLSAMLWLIQLALSARALCVAAGSSGAMRRPAVALQVLSFSLIPVAAVGLAFLPPSTDLLDILLLPWAAVTGWYILRAWNQSRPWIFWMALGQLALFVQHLLWRSVLPGLEQIDAGVGSLAALAVFAIATYLGMVWFSRLRAENALRVEARERIDPLTGLSMPRVFFDRVDGAIVRSHNLGYACALMLIRVENIEQIVADHGLDNNESVVLAASRAIAGTLRSHDSAARLTGNCFGVMVEGIAEGTANDLATKILANGLRAGEWGLMGSELQFQIALVEIDKTDIQSPAVLRKLEQALQQMADHHDSSHIRMLPRIRGKQGA